MSEKQKKKIAIIGGGPVGLAAAAHLHQRGLDYQLFEQGPQVGHHLRAVGHVRLFTPWKYLLDPASEMLLNSEQAWPSPELEEHPTALELIENYLEPFSNLSVVQERLHFGHQVVSISKQGHDRLKDGRRNEVPFVLRVVGPKGPFEVLADAVIDASGTWSTPNPLGADGLFAAGEQALARSIHYGMPDILGRAQNYENRTVLVVGKGHSAMGNLLALAELKEAKAQTEIVWALRGPLLDSFYGGGEQDELAARGSIGQRVKQLVRAGQISVLQNYAIAYLEEHQGQIQVQSTTGDKRVVDKIIASTGSRPAHRLTSELRLEFDPVTEAVRPLGPLIDPNHHSCGSVRPHGYQELSHPEQDFYTVGIKSYGRAPTFLLRTGYEQVRSVVAALAGDLEAAKKTELVLPQTGVCSSSAPTSKADAASASDSCCAPTTNSCC